MDICLFHNGHQTYIGLVSSYYELLSLSSSISNILHTTYLYIQFKIVEVMKVLIDAGANVNAQNQIAKMTPLQCAM